MADLACCAAPNEAALGFAIVLVQCFGLSRGFFRYWERLVGHQAAFRLLADLRVRVYTRLEALAPTGLPAFAAAISSPGSSTTWTLSRT